MDSNSPPLLDEVLADDVPHSSPEELQKRAVELMVEIREYHTKLDEKIAEAKQLLSEVAQLKPPKR